MEYLPEYNLEQLNKSSELVGEEIEWYASHNIYIEVLIDGYKLNQLCYRAIVTYPNNKGWHQEDVGAFRKWKNAYNAAKKEADRELYNR